MNTLVSIITPCYNASSFISITIESVIAQTYQNWELLIVDDCSSDNSADIINIYAKKDKRIKYFKTLKSSGSPTLPRNIAIQEAKGRYIAFLDSDDVWLPNKLEEQMDVFCNNSENIAVVFSNYEKISEDGSRKNRIIKAPKEVSYNGLLNGNVIGCLTGVYDTQKVGKVLMKFVPHEDYILWLSILKKGFNAKNTNTITALYRIRKGSVSANKLKTLTWQWNIYRKEERLNILYSSYHFIHYAVKALMKAIK